MASAEVPLRVSLDPLLWQEGQLLQPQHFQQAWLRQDALLARVMLAGSPHRWGLVRCRFDDARLAAGEFCVEELAAIMPDGTWVEAGPSQALRIDLTGVAGLEDGPVRIYLALPPQRPGSAAPGREGSRWVRRSDDTVLDENDGDTPEDVARLRPALRLALGARAEGDPQRHHAPLGLVAFPIAEVSRAGPDFVRQPFQPPCLRLDPGGAFEPELDRRMVAIERRMQRAAFAIAGRPALPAEARQTLGALTVAMARLVAHSPRGGPSPFALYQALVELCGLFAALGANPEIPDLPAYDHADLWSVYVRLLSFVDWRLAAIDQAAFAGIEFEPDGGGFRLAATTFDAPAPLLVVARLAPRQAQDACADWLAAATMGPPGEIAILQARRSLGHPRRQLVADDLRARGLDGDQVAFELQVDGAALGAGLAVLNAAGPPAGRPAGLTLLARPAIDREGDRR